MVEKLLWLTQQITSPTTAQKGGWENLSYCCLLSSVFLKGYSPSPLLWSRSVAPASGFCLQSFPVRVSGAALTLPSPRSLWRTGNNWVRAQVLYIIRSKCDKGWKRNSKLNNSKQVSLLTKVLNSIILKPQEVQYSLRIMSIHFDFVMEYVVMQWFIGLKIVLNKFEEKNWVISFKISSYHFWDMLRLNIISPKSYCNSKTSKKIIII